MFLLEPLYEAPPNNPSFDKTFGHTSFVLFTKTFNFVVWSSSLQGKIDDNVVIGELTTAVNFLGERDTVDSSGVKKIANILQKASNQRTQDPEVKTINRFHGE